MHLLIRFLSVLGVLAVIMHAASAVLSLLRGGVDAFIARGAAEERARRGDVTGMQEAAALRRQGTRRRALGVVRFCGWIMLLFIPSYTPWPAQMRAAYCILWLFPASHLRVRVR